MRMPTRRLSYKKDVQGFSVVVIVLLLPVLLWRGWWSRLMGSAVAPEDWHGRELDESKATVGSHWQAAATKYICLSELRIP